MPTNRIPGYIVDGPKGNVANGYIGHGVETDGKLVHFEGIMEWTVGMCAGKYRETPFYYIDLNAGNGQPIPGRDLIGSPLLAAEILHRRYGDASYRWCAWNKTERTWRNSTKHSKHIRMPEMRTATESR